MQCLEKFNHDVLTNKKNQWPNKFEFTLSILHFAEFLEVEGFTACCNHLQNIFSNKYFEQTHWPLIINIILQSVEHSTNPVTLATQIPWDAGSAII